MAMNAYDKYGPSCSDLFHVNSTPQRLRFCGTEIAKKIDHEESMKKVSFSEEPDVRVYSNTQTSVQECISNDKSSSFNTNDDQIDHNHYESNSSPKRFHPRNKNTIHGSKPPKYSRNSRYQQPPIRKFFKPPNQFSEQDMSKYKPKITTNNVNFIDQAEEFRLMKLQRGASLSHPQSTRYDDRKGNNKTLNNVSSQANNVNLTKDVEVIVPQKSSNNAAASSSSSNVNDTALDMIRSTTQLSESVKNLKSMKLTDLELMQQKLNEGFKKLKEKLILSSKTSVNNNLSSDDGDIVMKEASERTNQLTSESSDQGPRPLSTEPLTESLISSSTASTVNNHLHSITTTSAIVNESMSSSLATNTVDQSSAKSIAAITVNQSTPMGTATNIVDQISTISTAFVANAVTATAANTVVQSSAISTATSTVTQSTSSSTATSSTAASSNTVDQPITKKRKEIKHIIIKE